MTPFTAREFIDAIRELYNDARDRGWPEAPDLEAAIAHIERHGCPPADHIPDAGKVVPPSSGRPCHRSECDIEQREESETYPGEWLYGWPSGMPEGSRWEWDLDSDGSDVRRMTVIDGTVVLDQRDHWIQFRSYFRPGDRIRRIG